MTNLNDLLDKALSIYSKSNSGDIPIYVNNTPINIKLEVLKDCEGKMWINMTFIGNV